MNSCVLMAEIIKEPELRYTQDGQMAIAEMLVQFAGLRAEDPAETLKVVGWGNLAQQIQEQYHLGDRVVIEGRLGMNRVERPEGFKETRAELTVSRIHLLTAEGGLTSRVAVSGNETAPKAVASPAVTPSKPVTPAPTPTAAAKTKFQPPAPEPANPPSFNYDDIPF